MRKPAGGKQHPKAQGRAPGGRPGRGGKPGGGGAHKKPQHPPPAAAPPQEEEEDELDVSDEDMEWVAQHSQRLRFLADLDAAALQRKQDDK